MNTARSERVGTMSIGVPIKILHEAEGHIVTCETNTGEVSIHLSNTGYK